REMQPVLNSGGRIIGFFTWDHERPMTRLMDRLLPLVAGIAVALAGIAAFAVWQMRRVRRASAANDNAVPPAELAKPVAAKESTVALVVPANGSMSGDNTFIRREL